MGRSRHTEAQRLRALEDENSRLERLVADLSLDKEMLKAGDRKKRLRLVDRRTDASWLREQFAASQRRVCGLLSIAVRRASEPQATVAGVSRGGAVPEAEEAQALRSLS